jgi:hypothetical protein
LSPELYACAPKISKHKPTFQDLSGSNGALAITHSLTPAEAGPIVYSHTIPEWPQFVQKLSFQGLLLRLTQGLRVIQGLGLGRAGVALYSNRRFKTSRAISDT